MKKTILLSLLTMSTHSLVVKACADQDIRFLQANGSLKALVETNYQDTSTQSLISMHYTKPVIVHPDFSVAAFLAMPAKLQKNYCHEEADYIYLGARGLKGGMKLQDKMDALKKVALAYGAPNTHGIPIAYRKLIAIKAMDLALKNQNWAHRSFWLDTAKQKQIKQTIQQNITTLKDNYVKAKSKSMKLVKFKQELQTWENRFDEKGEAMQNAKNIFESYIDADRIEAIGGSVVAPIINQAYRKLTAPKAKKAVAAKGKNAVTPKAKKAVAAKGKNAVAPKAKKTVAAKGKNAVAPKAKKAMAAKGKEKPKQSLNQEIAQSSSGYTGSQVGRFVSQELELEENSAGDLAFRGGGTFVGRNVHGIAVNGLRETFTREALGTNAVASIAGVGGERIGETLGRMIGQNFLANEERGAIIGRAVGSVAAQTAGSMAAKALVAAACIIM
ncbi:MAG: hypothetical protein AAF380_01055 [Bacteroidota bacterium]